jgi:cation diffusion facilitator CzcD-associated flavoprotein CzcO
MPELPGAMGKGELSVDVLIIGAGFSGIATGIQLQKAGWNSFLILEKSPEIGGTWWENQYPGCACDIPSHLYSLSFEPSTEWSRMYPGQREIHEYLKACVVKHGLQQHIRPKSKLCEALWDESAAFWRVSTEDGLAIHAKVLVSAMGALHVPRYPELSGLERFAGPVFHSAEWNHRVDLNGKRVAVIGTGASAIQFVPQIAKSVKGLELFQRTPAWIVPRRDFAIPERWKWGFRHVPLARWAFRQFIFWRQELLVLGFLGNEKARKKVEAIALRHMGKVIKDPRLRSALTPQYALGCKRVLVSDDFYPALTEPTVKLVTGPVVQISEHGVVTEDVASGQQVEHPAEVLILATGFRATEPLIGCRIVGQNGVEIHDAWRSRMSAYLGIAVTGFPNFFMLLGPNTGLGHNSVVLMIEAQVRYLIRCLKLMRRKKQAILEVRPEAQTRFVEEVYQRLEQTVWRAGGCRSWYQDQRTGEVTTLWPGSVLAYFRRTRSVKAGDYAWRSPQRGPGE